MAQLSGVTSESNIEAYLAQHQAKELLRFVTVGSVDDGKSTLIGRLLYDTNGVYDDQLAAVKKASLQNNMEIDFSLFTDGLEAEREQGITIDVAYRYFSTAKRKFIIADTPGHVQYTRNMATGASTADAAIILIDARLGVLPQSRRHAYIGSLLGIPYLLVAVNKMDLKAYEPAVFEQIVADFNGFAKHLRFREVTFVPISALAGDNVVEPSSRTPWYRGPTILQCLETLPIASQRNLSDFRYPVQYVLRPDLNYRGIAGQIASGTVRKGDRVMVLPSRLETTITGIDTFDGALEQAFAPMSVSLTLAQEIDVSRGDWLVHPQQLPSFGRRFEAQLVWMSEQPLELHKSYQLKLTTQQVKVDVESIVSLRDLETLSECNGETLSLNDIGRVRLSCHRALCFDPYERNRATGAFILIDPLTNNTCAAGMIIAPTASTELAKATGYSDSEAVRSLVTPQERARLQRQRGTLILLNGPRACGKTALAQLLERRLFDCGRLVTLVDAADAIAEAGEFALGDGSRLNEVVLQVVQRAVEAGLFVVMPCRLVASSDRALLVSRLGVEQLLEIRLSSAARTEAALPAEPLASGVGLQPLLTVSYSAADAESVVDRIIECIESCGRCSD